MSARRAAIAAVGRHRRVHHVRRAGSGPGRSKGAEQAHEPAADGEDDVDVSIAWDAATDSSGKLSYEMHLWQDPRVPVLPQTQTSFTWTGLRPSVQYYLWVVASDAAGNKSFSDQLIVETPRDTIAPTAPTDLGVDSVTASQMALSWGPATDESAVASYAVFTPSGQIVEWTAGASRDVIGLPPNRQSPSTSRRGSPQREPAIEMRQ